jgi:hypothetical protein
MGHGDPADGVFNQRKTASPPSVSGIADDAAVAGSTASHRERTMEARAPETPLDAQGYAAEIKLRLVQVVQLARAGVSHVQDPKAQALFETTAEACIGLGKAYEDYAQRRPAWR